MAASIAQLFSQLPCWTSDAALLERYIHQRDEAAFTALVARHGGLVLRLCRRILGDVHAAEDAFQATFFILARKAHLLKQPDGLPAWLYGVARRVALKARTKSAHRTSESLDEMLPDPCPDPLAQLSARELLDVLDEEVQRLPAAQRSALVLCCLEGHTQEEAARILGWTPGSIKGRLERGRQRLQARLQRRGIALSAALALVVVTRDRVAARVPALLLQSTVRAALHGGIGGAASALAHSVLQTMFWTKLAGAMAVALTLALAASTTAALVYRWSVEAPEDETPSVTSKTPVRVKVPNDPLPEGAIARLGTHRFRHGGWIKFTAFTPDDKRLVSQGEDGVRVWDAATGKEMQHSLPEAGKIWGATDLSPDGKSLAATIESSDGHIDVWDVASSKKTASFGQGYYAIVRFSPDGKRLAAFETAKGWQRSIELWDVASQRRLLAWKAHGGHQVMNLFFSRDARQLFTCASDGKVRVWDAATARQLREFTRLDWEIARNNLSPFNQNEALSPDGNLLALWEENKKSTARISLRDTTTGEQVRLITCPTRKAGSRQEPGFSALTFTPDGKKLLTGGPDDFLRFWDAATGEELQRWPLEFGRPWSLTPSRDGKTLAVVMNQGNSIQLLDMASGKPRPSHAGHLAGVGFPALTPDGRTAVTESLDGLFFWDVAASRLRLAFNVPDRGLAALELAPDGRTIYAIGWNDKAVRILDLAKGEERRQIPLGREFTPSAWGALALSPDGKTIAVSSFPQTIRLFDTSSGRERLRFEGPQWVQGSAFTADSHSIVIWSGDLKVRIWDAATGRQRCEYPLTQDLRIGQPKFGFTAEGKAVTPPTNYHAALSPDGRLLAIGNDRHVLPLEKCFLVFKDLATGRDIRRLDRLPTDVHRIAFSPDGRMLAWGGRMDPTIYLMETASGRERRRFVGHHGWVLSLAFSADGARLISGSTDTTALVWDVGRRLDSSKTPTALTAADVEKLWANLAGEDAARAYEAIPKLAAAPNAAIPFLRRHVQPISAVDEKRLVRLLADLDSDDFAARQKAAADLESLGELTLPAYRKALDSKPSLETRRRLEDLQTKAHAAWWDVSGERLRSLRAIEALELAGTQEAREALATLAAGADGARLTEEAKAALKRLANGRR